MYQQKELPQLELDFLEVTQHGLLFLKIKCLNGAKISGDFHPFVKNGQDNQDRKLQQDLSWANRKSGSTNWTRISFGRSFALKQGHVAAAPLSASNSVT